MRSVWIACWFSLGCVAANSAEAPFEMVEAEAGSDVQVVGATPAAAGEWPATFRFTRNGKFCTSTIVGERAILTAAHCVGDGQPGTIKIAGQSISVRCRQHPTYRSNDHYDLALCLAASTIVLPNGAKYETLNADKTVPDVGTPITLLGFGCRRADGQGPSGALYQGQSKLTVARFVYIYTVGGASVCFGDSGGAAYYDDSGVRTIAGVSSQAFANAKSSLTNVSNPAVSTFIQSWSSANAAAVCGVSSQGGKCK